MKIKVILSVLAIAAVLAGCSSNQVKGPQADPNYMQAVNSFNQQQLAKVQMVEALAKGCQGTDDSAWCTALVSSQLTGSQAGGTFQTQAPPTFQTQPSTGALLTGKLVDGIFGVAKAGIAPYVNLEITKSNNDAREAIETSRNETLGTIVTSGFDNLGTVGARETIAVGGDYVAGDGNNLGDAAGDGDRYGDGNNLGDGAGNGDRFGDENIIGNGNNEGDSNNIGAGDRFGPGDELVGSQNGDSRDNGDDDSEDLISP